MKEKRVYNSKAVIKISTLLLLSLISIALLASATTPLWKGTTTNYTTTEDNNYYHDLRQNITGYNNDITFTFDTDNDIQWTNSSGTYNVTTTQVRNWISITNQTTGNLTINATYDNQTGFFQIPLQATNTTDEEGAVTTFEFIINATNDKPRITNQTTIYNLTVNEAFNTYINATDEEEHYPLTYNLTFINNCTHAAWSGRNTGENCSITNITSINNKEAQINYTPTNNDTGTYWAWISTTDAAEQYGCPHNYCNNNTYATNKTSNTQIIIFNIFSTLTINAENCTGQQLREQEQFTCTITITTRGENDTLQLSSYANFGNGYEGTIENRSWFYPNNTINATANQANINISITPTKKEVGNWSITFNAEDTNNNLSATTTIPLNISWNESNTTLNSINDRTVYENEEFSVRAYDNDLLIQDKQTKNEQLTFGSNTSWVSITGTQTITGNNYTTATITIDFDTIAGAGDANYSILINTTDTGGSISEQTFTITILNDTAAEWNQTKNYNLTYNETENIYLNLTEYVTDSDGDNITFSHQGTSPTNFDLTTNGIINFTTNDEDVGYYTIIINASDGKLDSLQQFNISITNHNETPIIEDQPTTITATEGTNKEITLNIRDEDLNIPQTQKSYYNETLTLNITFQNLTSTTENINYNYTISLQTGNLTTYTANFTPEGKHVGTYNVTITVTDASGLNDTEYYQLNITAINDAPNMSTLENKTTTINTQFTYDINATDEEDSPTLPENGNLTYTITNLTTNGNFLTINNTTGIINITLNETHQGRWEYNISVNDTTGTTTSNTFTLTVYGRPNITSPQTSTTYQWEEGNTTQNIPFNISYAVNNTNLTYLYYIDKITYQDSENYTYSNLTTNNSLRINTTQQWNNTNNNYNLNYTLQYTDETYGKEKNLTLIVYNQQYPELNDTKTWKINITHKNQNVTFKGTNIPDQEGTVGNTKTINLSTYFEDEDHQDPYYNQNVNYTITTITGAGYIKAAASYNDWILTLSSPTATNELITLTATEYDNNTYIGNSTSNQFWANFSTVTTSGGSSGSSSGGGGGGTTTKLQFFSLKLIVPERVIILEDQIEVGFSIQNTGQIALAGINLGSIVTFNNQQSEDISITLEEDYIPTLGIGEMKNYTMNIKAETDKSGRYKARILANVTAPKFSDYADFFIDLRETNESQARQLLIFLEELIEENPECLELTENLKRAEQQLEEGNYRTTLELTRATIRACEESVTDNEQTLHPLRIAQESFYIIAYTTLITFFIGFIFYIYKRRRFNKYPIDKIYKRGKQ